MTDSDPQDTTEVELREELEELAEEWEEVASWGDRENQSRYQRGLKDADRQHARELREVLQA